MGTIRWVVVGVRPWRRIAVVGCGEERGRGGGGGREGQAPLLLCFLSRERERERERLWLLLRCLGLLLRLRLRRRQLLWWLLCLCVWDGWVGGWIDGGEEAKLRLLTWSS